MVSAECDSKKHYAAQNAREGLINVNDLSLLTGIAVTQLTKFAKTGLLEHYGEYHGKRFYNFEKIVNWACEPDTENQARVAIRNGFEAEMRMADCPFTFQKVQAGDETQIKITWNAVAEQAA